LYDGRQEQFLSFVEGLEVFRLSCQKRSANAQKRSASPKSQCLCKFALGNRPKAQCRAKITPSVSKSAVPTCLTQKCSATLPKAQRQASFTQTHSSLPFFSHLLTPCLANEDNEFENEM